jgi:predicted nucleic acid-binding protein
VAAYYRDSSALVKRYISEAGTLWIQALTDASAGHLVLTVTLSGPEAISAIVRRARGGQLRRIDAARAVADVSFDWQAQYVLIDVDRRIVRRAMALAEHHGLRGYDAVHAPAAVEIHAGRDARGDPPLIFISADQDQLATAKTEGLQVDDPTRCR